MTTITKPTHAVAIFGGACSGSVAAEILAEQGCQVVVFEQNPRPYGKIEDGLPRWHKEQRLMEYGKIDERLDRANVTYVPKTKLGEDVQFDDVYRWGWSAVLLANGAWKDRPLDAEGADDVVDKGLVYQNPFIYWFNHYEEQGYDGPRYEIPDGPVCVGGGLASIDVVKAFQLELYGRALRAKGIKVDLIELEHQGIPKFCAAHGIDDPASLGVTNATLIYRRRADDMPLASPPKGASEKQLAKIATVRQKILDKCQRNFLFEFVPQAVTKSVIVEDGRLVGLVLLKTELDEKGRAREVEGSEFELRTHLVVSSIGSIPEPIPGIEMNGTYYKYKDWDTGEYEPLPGVYGVGNVVTGQGNIKASLEHGKAVGHHLAENYLGVGDDHERDLSAAFDIMDAKGAAAAALIADRLKKVKPLAAAHVEQLLAKAHARQAEVGYTGDYRGWLKQVTPPDLG